MYVLRFIFGTVMFCLLSILAICLVVPALVYIFGDGRSYKNRSIKALCGLRPALGVKLAPTKPLTFTDYNGFEYIIDAYSSVTALRHLGLYTYCVCKRHHTDSQLYFIMDKIIYISSFFQTGA